MPRPESLSPDAPDGRDVSDPAPSAEPAPPVFVASCQNCTRFLQGNCSLGRILAPGKLLCADYEITPAFRDQLVSVMMKDILTQVQETAGRVQKLRAAQRLWN